MREEKPKAGKQIHWFPGHMASAVRELKESWRHIDAVLEVADARIPASSRNPLFEQFKPPKPHLLVLSHADLADQASSLQWQDYYGQEGLAALACDLRRKSDLSRIRRQLLTIHQPLLEKAKKQGRIVRPLRILVAGIPNTGKSTLINQMVGKRSAEVAARPGVTRRLNWLRAGTELHFLDTPGILPARLDDREAALSLAATGAIRDSILPLEAVALWLFNLLSIRYPDRMRERYGESLEFEAAALAMGCLLPEDRPDLRRFSTQVLDDFRSGRIGRLTLDLPPVDRRI